MRQTVCVCPACHHRADEDRDGQRCDSYGCGGRYAATLFPETVDGRPAADLPDGWGSTMAQGHRVPDPYLFDMKPYADAPGRRS